MAREGGAYLALGLGLLVANLKVLCALDGLQADGLAVGARQTQGDLLGSLRLLVEDGLRLTTKPSLLAVVPPLALRHKRGLAGLVLRNLEDLVVAALGRLAEGLGRLRGVHHCKVPARVGAETQASSGATGNERSATGVPRGQPADVGIIPNKRQFQLRQSPPGAAPLHPMTTTPHLLEADSSMSPLVSRGSNRHSEAVDVHGIRYTATSAIARPPTSIASPPRPLRHKPAPQGWQP